MDNESTISKLTSLSACANISLDEVLKDFEIMTNKKILEQHKYDIYYSESEKSWRTYLPDDTHPRKRRPIKNKSRENPIRLQSSCPFTSSSEWARQKRLHGRTLILKKGRFICTGRY